MRILLLSLYYKPLNNIASTRIVAFKKHLEELGHHVDILTRHYSEIQLKTSNLSIAMIEGDDFDGDYYKKDGVIYCKYKSNNSKIKVSKKLPKGIKGGYNLLQLDVFHYSYVEYGLKAYEKEFSNNPHDVIIASSPPSVALLLAKELNKKFYIPWIADFRDSFIMGDESFFIKQMKIIALNRVLNSSRGFIFLSEGMKDICLNSFNNKNKNKPFSLIYNGTPIFLNEDLNLLIVDKINSLKKEYKYLLAYTGSLYKEANLDFYLENISNNISKDVIFVLVGIQEEFKVDIIQKFGKRLNFQFFDKTTVSTSIYIQKSADFLLLNIWKGKYSGFSGKIFEYLNANTKILVDKEPAKDLLHFTHDFNNVYYCNEDISIYNSLLKNNPPITPITKKQKEHLTRAFQVKKLNDFILNLYKNI